MTDQTLDAAHTYTKNGYALTPLYGVRQDICTCKKAAACPSGGKHPRGTRGGGWNILTNGPDVQAWFEDHPDDNIGILTGTASGIFIVDVDGPTGISSILSLADEHGQLPLTRTIATGSGGFHYYFVHPDDFEVRNSTSWLAPNIDIRGKGGQVVAPPSASARGPYVTLLDLPVAEAPPWLLQQLAEHAEGVDLGHRADIKAAEPYDDANLTDSLRALLGDVSPVPARFRRAYAIVAGCFEAGYTQGQTVAIIGPWCEAVGKFVGRVEQEVARTWGKLESDAAKADEWVAGLGTPRPTLPNGGNLGSRSSLLDVPALEPDEEAEFWAARPILTHLHTFARARMVSPWAVLGVALARIITATPNTVCLPPIIGGRASLNLFVGIVGDSGSGKGAAESVAAEALNVGYIQSHNVGSGEGIAHGYKHREKGALVWNDDAHAVLFSVPEIDSLAAQGDRKGATLMPQLRSGWTGEQLGFGYADPMKRIIVEAHEYRLCLVAGIQPGRAGCLLDDTDGGTPQRFLWMPATDPDIPDEEPKAPNPIIWNAPSPSKIVSVWGAHVDVCDLAKTTIKEARRARVRGDGNALDGHALLAQLKTAAALGIYEGRYSVTDDDWALAGTIAQKSAATRAGVVEMLRRKVVDTNAGRAETEAHRAVLVDDTLVEAGVQRACKTIRKRMQRIAGPHSRSDLRNSLSSRDRGNFDAAIGRLVESAELRVAEGAAGGTFYDLESNA